MSDNSEKLGKKDIRDDIALKLIKGLGVPKCERILIILWCFKYSKESLLEGCHASLRSL